MTQEQTKNRPRLIAIGGGKGGIGKTVISTCLSIALVRYGKSVILVDGDLGGANLHTVMGISMPPRTLYDFITRRIAKLSNLPIETPIPGLRLICGAPGSPGMANIKYWEKQKTIRHLRQLDADFVVVDVGAGMSFNEVDLFNASEVGIVIANPEPPSIQECYNFIKVALFRKLRTTLSGHAQIMAVLDGHRDHSHLRDRRLVSDLIQELRDRDLEAAQRLERTIRGFEPRLILNCVHDESESLDARALQLAVSDLLGVQLRFLGFVPYSKSVKQAIQTMRPTKLLSEDVAVRSRIFEIVNRHFINPIVAQA